MEQFNHYLSQFIETHHLPETYRPPALKWFKKLGDNINERHNGANETLFVGINGCQGSGKSTLADFLSGYLKKIHNKNTIAVSLDDFYLTKAERSALANNVHPLFSTRGVPGTHDVKLMRATLAQFREAKTTLVPRFDKAIDDRFNDKYWSKIDGPVDIVILEGWCLGIGAQVEDDLSLHANEFEEKFDNDTKWRTIVNSKIEEEYESLYNTVDFWIMLRAPSFEHVYRWRLEQEQKLKAALIQKGEDGTNVMSESDVLRFIQFYERLTNHGLSTLPEKCDIVYQLDQHRQITHCIEK